MGITTGMHIQSQAETDLPGDVCWIKTEEALSNL